MLECLFCARAEFFFRWDYITVKKTFWTRQRIVITTRWSGELMVSLMPMNGEVEPNSTIQFTCSYDYPDKFYIYFKLSSHDGFPITARGGKIGPIMKTEKGAVRTWFVHMGHTPCNVECHIVNHGKELVKIVTSITPGLTDCIARAFASCPSIGDSWCGRCSSSRNHACVVTRSP